ncbi:MAG: CYTH domain-containing protein [Patescibacteria group bacterium]|nr:CYTH domain-containing protein [Patescibacteria group bacterium]
MADVECEVRSFIDADKLAELDAKFREEGEFLGEEHQETHYFDCEQDLRIQRSDSGSKVWLKKGKLHDDSREEIEIRSGFDDFSKLADLFAELDYGTEIKWFRHRRRYEWRGVKVTLDSTKGYGDIIELESVVPEVEKEGCVAGLKTLMSRLDIEPTPKEEFKRRFEHYKANWKELVEEER